jgi:hypothetical protein
VAQLSGPLQSADGSKVLQISRRGRARCFGDSDVVLGAEPALESVDSLLEHSGNHCLLPRVQLAAQPLVESCLGNVEIDSLDRIALCLDRRFGEVAEPIRYLQFLVIALQRGVIRLARPLDGVGKRDQTGLTQILREGFFRERARNPSVAVFERVNADKIQMD